MVRPIYFPQQVIMISLESDMGNVGITCDSTAAHQVCERGVESRGAPEVGVQQDFYSLAQLV